jgi:dinuclear metal center YbgI/SA1388 family protein
MSVKCQVIMDAMDKLAPRHLAEEWDNVGLLLGSPAQAINKVRIALDVTESVVTRAIADQVDMLIAHHPVIFKGLQQIRTDLPQGRLVAALLKADIAVYASHTNLDIADKGVNDVLARCFGLEAVEPLTVSSTESLCKLVVFVPHSHADEVRKAIAGAGAGNIGNYSHSSFQTTGTGTFLPLAGANPYIGQQGRLECVEEVRLETILPERILRRVIKAMLKVHPYEEAAYDIFPVKNHGKVYGLGRIGKLTSPLTLEKFAHMVKARLGAAGLRLVGAPDKVVSKVAVCGGSGANLLHKAAFAGADVLVTGDVKYHEAQDALAAGLALIDAGHFSTEVPVLAPVRDYLAECAASGKWAVEIALDPMEQDVFTIV